MEKMHRKLERMIQKYQAGKGKITAGHIRHYKKEMELEKYYPETEVQEVDQVRIMFAHFFVQSTDFSYLNIPAKLDNIHNQREIDKSSYRDLITSILLQRKVVMMIEMNGAKNFVYEGYQRTFLEDQRVVTRFIRQESNLVLERQAREQVDAVRLALQLRLKQPE